MGFGQKINSDYLEFWGQNSRLANLFYNKEATSRALRKANQPDNTDEQIDKEIAIEQQFTVYEIATPNIEPSYLSSLAYVLTGALKQAWKYAPSLYGPSVPDKNGLITQPRKQQGVIERWVESGFSTTHDEYLSRFSEALAEFEQSKITQTHEGSTRGFPVAQYLFANVIIEVIKKHGLTKAEHKYVLKPEVVKWLKESNVAKNLLYANTIYKQGWVESKTFLDMFANANEKFICELNKAIEALSDEDKEKNYRYQIDGFVTDRLPDYADERSKDAIFKFLRAIHKKEESTEALEAYRALSMFRTIGENESQARVRALLEILKHGVNNPYFDIQGFQLYQIIATVEAEERQRFNNALYTALVNAHNQDDEYNKAVQTLLYTLPAYENAKDKADREIWIHAMLMGFGGAAFAADVVVGFWEMLLFSGVEPEPEVLFFVSMFTLIFLSAFMGVFFKKGHQGELYKALIEENFEKAVEHNNVTSFPDEQDDDQDKLPDNVRAWAWIVKQFGTCAEGFFAAVGTYAAFAFISDMSVVYFTNQEIDAFVPSQITIEYFNGTTGGIAMLGFAIAVVILVSFAVGNSLRLGHKTLDGPNSDEMIFKEHLDWEEKTQLPTQNGILSFDWKNRHKATVKNAISELQLPQHEFSLGPSV